MARRSLALLSEGMLSGSLKKTITIASIGWLVITGVVPPVPPTPPDTGGGGGGISHHAGKKEKEIRDGRRKKILKDDDEFWAIVKMWVESNNS